MNETKTPLQSGAATYLALGSNLGNREQALDRAVTELSEFMAGLRMSRIYETEPLYVRDQPRFLNAVVCGTTKMPCFELLSRVQRIELKMGRDRCSVPRHGARVIDIDILLFGTTVLTTRTLVIPHPEMVERQFVLLPLMDLAPELAHPATGVPFSDSLARLENQGVYSYKPRDYNPSAL